MNEGLTFMWLLMISGIAIAALMDGKLHPYHTARRFGWLACLAVVVMVPVFTLAS